jgi:hypothetical protein
LPRILIELSDDEYRVLLAAAKRDRRTAQAQAAQLLVGLLAEWQEKGKIIDADEAERRRSSDATTLEALRLQQQLAEPQGNARAAAAGSLPSEE